MTAKGAQALRAAIGRFEPMGDQDADRLLAHARSRTLSAGEFLLRAGERACTIALLVEGVIREYFPLANGKERTRAFAQEGEFAGSLADLVGAQPSTSSAIAVTPVALVVVPWSCFTDLRERHVAWARFAFRVAEHYFVAKARREYELLALDATLRYAAFRRSFPGLESRITQAHVASYLGVSPEHLSRLRRAQSESGSPSA